MSPQNLDSRASMGTLPITAAPLHLKIPFFTMFTFDSSGGLLLAHFTSPLYTRTLLALFFIASGRGAYLQSMGLEQDGLEAEDLSDGEIKLLLQRAEKRLNNRTSNLDSNEVALSLPALKIISQPYEGSLTFTKHIAKPSAGFPSSERVLWKSHISLPATG